MAESDALEAARTQRFRDKTEPLHYNPIFSPAALYNLAIKGEQYMHNGLQIRKEGALDLLSLGALVHRLDPGVIPFRKAMTCQIHVSGGEFNVAANLADC